MRSLLKKLSVLGCVFALCAGGARADQFDDLSTRFAGTLQSLHASTFANGLYIAVGDGGTILTSPDSVSWQLQMSGTTNRLNAVRYGTNGFVAVGDSATVLRSPDGLNWTPASVSVTNKLSGITYADGRYVAVGSKGVILTSTNTVNWTAILTGAPYDLNAVEAGFANVYPREFVAVGDSGLVMTSLDGLGWTARSSGNFHNLRGVAQWNRAWVTVGDGGAIANSPDGITWTVQGSPTPNNLLGVGSDGRSSFGAVGDGGVFIITSNGGSTWTTASSGTTNRLFGMYYANGAHMAVGEAGTIQSGYVWLPRNSGTTINLDQVVYGNGRYVVVGTTNFNSLNYYGIILSSTNAINWTPQLSGLGAQAVSVAFGNGRFVAAGRNGTILTSTNGTLWTSNNIASTNWLVLVTFLKQTFYIQGSIVLASTNGTSWTNLSTLPAYLPMQMAQAGNLLVGVNGDTNTATSTDGTNWFAQNTRARSGLGGVSYGNGLFAAVGGRDLSMPTQIYSSPDGTNWTSRSSGSMNDGALAFGGPGFATVGTMFDFGLPNLQTSSDGITWSMRGIEVLYQNLIFTNGTFVAVGAGGSIAQSIPPDSRASPRLAAKVSGGQFQISAFAQPGYNYRIQKSTNPATTNWVDAFTFTSTQTQTNFVTTMSGAGAFYRIISP